MDLIAQADGQLCSVVQHLHGVLSFLLMPVVLLYKNLFVTVFGFLIFENYNQGCRLLCLTSSVYSFLTIVKTFLPFSRPLFLGLHPSAAFTFPHTYGFPSVPSTMATFLFLECRKRFPRIRSVLKADQAIRSATICGFIEASLGTSYIYQCAAGVACGYLFHIYISPRFVAWRPSYSLATYFLVSALVTELFAFVLGMNIPPTNVKSGLDCLSRERTYSIHFPRVREIFLPISLIAATTKLKLTPHSTDFQQLLTGQSVPMRLRALVVLCLLVVNTIITSVLGRITGNSIVGMILSSFAEASLFIFVICDVAPKRFFEKQVKAEEDFFALLKPMLIQAVPKQKKSTPSSSPTRGSPDDEVQSATISTRPKIMPIKSKDLLTNWTGHLKKIAGRKVRRESKPSQSEQKSSGQVSSSMYQAISPTGLNDGTAVNSIDEQMPMLPLLSSDKNPPKGLSNEPAIALDVKPAKGSGPHTSSPMKTDSALSTGTMDTFAGLSPPKEREEDAGELCAGKQLSAAGKTGVLASDEKQKSEMTESPTKGTSSKLETLDTIAQFSPPKEHVDKDKPTSAKDGKVAVSKKSKKRSQAKAVSENPAKAPEGVERQQKSEMTTSSPMKGTSSKLETLDTIAQLSPPKEKDATVIPDQTDNPILSEAKYSDGNPAVNEPDKKINKLVSVNKEEVTMKNTKSEVGGEGSTVSTENIPTKPSDKDTDGSLTQQEATEGNTANKIAAKDNSVSNEGQAKIQSPKITKGQKDESSPTSKHAFKAPVNSPKHR